MDAFTIPTSGSMMVAKCLLVLRLFHGPSISFDHPVPSRDDQNWISVKNRKPEPVNFSKTAYLVWAKDSKNFVFKAFYIFNSTQIHGFWNAEDFLDSHIFGEITHWMPLPDLPETFDPKVFREKEGEFEGIPDSCTE